MRVRRSFRSCVAAGAALLAVAGAACGDAPAAEQAGAAPGAAAARAAADSLTFALQDAVVRKDAAAIAALFTEDAVLHLPDGGVVEGREAIAARVARVLPSVQGYSITSQRFGASGDLAYDAQTFQLTLTDGPGAARTLTGRHLAVLERQDGGEWQITRSGSWPGTPPAEPHVH